MAYAQTGFTRFPRSGPIARIRQLREMLETQAARRAAYRRTVAELQAFSDSELAEFGFHRSEIPALARRAIRTA